MLSWDMVIRPAESMATPLTESRLDVMRLPEWMEYAKMLHGGEVDW
jgi:hypothetical protein